MYDVIIVGAGVAGCYLASQLNINVLIIEKNKSVFLKDSGIVSTKIDKFLDFKKRKEIKEMKIISPSGSSFELKSEKAYAYLLNRIEFSKFLRKEAKKKAKISYETVLDINYKEDFAEVITDKSTYQAKMVVGCDGANSTVRRKFIKDVNLCTGIMCFTKMDKKEIEVYFNKEYSKDFFTWIIPQSNEYGLMTKDNPIPYLDKFASDLKLKKGKIIGYKIPIGTNKSFFNRTLLIGDACGMTKPLTEGGIIFSLTACIRAKEIIEKSFQNNIFDENFLKQYEDKWKKDFGFEIKKQLFIRNKYSKLTNSDIDRMFKKFGPSVEKINEFDYDHLTNSWTKLPKIEMIKEAVKLIL